MKFIDILNQLNIQYRTSGHHHCRPGWIQIDCPYCGRDSNKWHLGYSLEGNFLNCWKCGSHPLISTLMECSHLPFKTVKKALTNLDSPPPPKERPQGKLRIPKGVKPLARPHRNYLHKRRFYSSKLEKAWGIKGIGVASRLSWRIFIPIIYHSKTVSWTTRTISEKSRPRYISASEVEESIPHKSLLYGEDFARHAIIIVEGPFDAWRIGPGAVATFSTGVSQSQIEKMLKYPIRGVCFDNEPDAQKRAIKLCNNLSVFPGETFNIQLDDGVKDSAEMNLKQVKYLREKILE